MNIVVIGAGRVGEAIAARLSDEGHDVTIIERDEERLSSVSNTVDAMTIAGNGADFDVLTMAGVAKTDLVIAVTNDDAVNMICCLSAKKLGAKNAVARVSTMEYYKQMVFLKDELGLAFVFNPEKAAAGEISRILRFPSAAKVESFAKDRAELVEFSVGADTKLDGLKLLLLRERFGEGVLICAVERRDQIFIPGGDFQLQADDTVYVVGAPSQMSAFFKAAGIYKKGVRNVIILGGGRIALYLGHELLDSGIRVKIIERSDVNCATIKDILPKADVILGDGTRPALLEEEGIREADAFVSLIGSDQANIITSMFAAKSGTGKVITKINNEYFCGMADYPGLESFVTPKSIAADHIVSYVRAMQKSYDSSGIESMHMLAGDRVEALEFTIREKGTHINIPLKTLNMRAGTIIAAIIRGSACIIPKGDDVIKPGDSVIAVTTRFGTQSFDDLFEGE